MDACVPRRPRLVRSRMAHYIPFLALTQTHHLFGSPWTAPTRMSPSGKWSDGAGRRKRRGLCRVAGLHLSRPRGPQGPRRDLRVRAPRHARPRRRDLSQLSFAGHLGYDLLSRCSPRQSMIGGHFCMLCNAGVGSALSRVRVICGWIYVRGGEYRGRSLWL
jgi:hypothetical protein